MDGWEVSSTGRWLYWTPPFRWELEQCSWFCAEVSFAPCVRDHTLCSSAILQPSRPLREVVWTPEFALALWTLQGY